MGAKIFRGSRRRNLAAVLMAAAWILVTATSAGATALPATIGENTTLTAAGAPYTGSPTIETGVVVKIEPGTKLTLGSLTVKGTLRAEGTASEPIVFTSGAAQPKPGNWSYIKFEPGSGGSILDHTEVAYGGSSEIGSIEINAASPTITNSTIRKSKFVAISIPHGGSPEIAHNTFIENGMVFAGRAAISYYATPAEPGDVNIHDNTVEKGGAGISVSNTSVSGLGKTLGGNIVIGTWGGALSYAGTDIPPDIAENVLSGNEGSNNISVSGTVAHSAIWKRGGADLKGGDVTVAAGVTLQINPGFVFYPNKVVVKGTLKAEGTFSEPVTFTSAAKERKPGDWKQIKFEPGSGESVINHAQIFYGAGGEIGAVEIAGASPRITHTTFWKNQAHAIKATAGGSPVIADNLFVENGFFYLGREVITYTATPTAAGSIDIHNNTIEGSGGGGINVSNSSAGKVDINDNTVLGSAGPGISIAQAATNGGGGTVGGNVLTGNGGAGLSYSGTDIPGNITENFLSGNNPNRLVIAGTVAHSSSWGKGNVPIGLGEVTISSGVTLTIDPGVTLIPNNKVIVKGTLKAEGTAEAPIAFTSGASEPKPGTWNYMKFEPGSGGSVLKHVEVAYGGSSEVGAVEINASSPTIMHSIFRNNQSSAVRIPHGGNPEIAYNKFTGNGFYFLGRATLTYAATPAEPGLVDIHDNMVESGGGAGITVSNTSTPGASGSLSGNKVTGNKGPGITFSGVDIPGDITENELESNSSDEIQVAGTVAHSSEWHLGGSPVRFTGPVVVASGVTLSLKPGVYIRSPQMTVKGVLRTEGTASRPVSLTGPLEEKGGEWGGITFEPGSAGWINYTQIGFGGSGIPMLNIKGVSPSIKNSTLRRSSSDAIRVQSSGQPTIEGNRFRNNQFGLRYEGEGKLSASGNDWGCASGPKPTGCGDSVTSNVDWQPAVVLQELPRLCPGTVMLASSSACLLQKYQPTLQLDSEENYRADDAAEITDNWGDDEGVHRQGALGGYTNVLLDGSMPIAESAPWGFYSMFPLNLSNLGSNYPAGYGGAAADEDDWIDESNEYVKDAHRLEEVGYENAAYGRAITDVNGKRWLEYWYWYYYNPKSFAGIGTHEGDWESVLVGLDSNNRPLEVIFSQHESPSNCYIGDIEVAGEGGPVIYVALDSHANYPMSGTFDGGVVTDYADGGGPSVQPGLVILENSPPSWLAWPGHWGNSRGGGLNSESPRGPAFHGAWEDPAGYAAGADECSRTLEEELEEPYEFQANGRTPVAALSAVTLDEQKPEVEYRVSGADGEGFWPRLRISVDELGDRGIPPVSTTISNVKARGRLTLPVKVKPGHSAEVFGSIVYKSGRRVHLAPRMVQSPRDTLQAIVHTQEVWRLG